MQIIVIHELPDEKNEYIKSLTNDLKIDTAKRLIQKAETAGTEYRKNLVDEVLHAAIDANKSLFRIGKEKNNMAWEKVMGVLREEIKEYYKNELEAYAKEMAEVYAKEKIEAQVAKESEKVLAEESKKTERERRRAEKAEALLANKDAEIAALKAQLAKA